MQDEMLYVNISRFSRSAYGFTCTETLVRKHQVTGLGKFDRGSFPVRMKSISIPAVWTDCKVRRTY